jgi:hypothetical protein
MPFDERQQNEVAVIYFCKTPSRPYTEKLKGSPVSSQQLPPKGFRRFDRLREAFGPIYAS